MDPLSITTSILTLIGAASKTYGFLQFIAHADQDATSLCAEVSGLESVLSLVQAALKRCGGNPVNLASIDQGLWRRIDITLSDCRETLDGLSQLAQRIRCKHSALVPGILYRAGVAKRLQQHTKDVASYRDRIKVSNWNLQTLLQVIDVSLSLANRDSYAQISSQLDLLNQRVQDRVKVSLCLNRSNSISERRFVHNTEDFLLAIKAFHKSASTTAGTVRGHSEHGRDTTGATDQYESSSVVFRMPTRKRHEIVTLLQRNEKQELLPTTPTVLQVNDAKAIASPLDGPQLAPLRINPTTVLTDGFSKLAHKAIQDLDFLGAETFLRRAMEQHKSTGVDSVQHRRLRKQLSLSLFFQGRDKDAKELVLDLAEHYGEGLSTTSQLLFALALSLAHDMEFDEARTICEQLCQLRCISDDGTSGMLSKSDIFRLLVTCYRQSRDWMSADAIIAEIPDIDEDQCVPSPLEFILGSNDLLLEFLGDADCRTTPSIFVSQVQRLPVAKRVTRLQERLDGASLFTTRFATSETSDDRDGDGLLRLKSRHFRSAPQAVETGPKNKHASLHATCGRVSASLKHLAIKIRLHSSFELLQWQRCTPEVEKRTPVRDILSWREGQAVGHGMTPITERFSGDTDFSLDISGFQALPIPEMDSIEVTDKATPPHHDKQIRASCRPAAAVYPTEYTITGIPWTIPITERFPDNTDFLLDILGFQELQIPEIDSIEVTDAATPPHHDKQIRASCRPSVAVYPTECTTAGIPVLCSSPRPDSRTSLIWDPLSSAWICPSDLTVPAFSWEGRSHNNVPANTLSMNASHASQCSPITEETEVHELCAEMDYCDQPNPYSAAEREMESEVCYYLRQVLEVIPEFSNHAPNDLIFTSKYLELPAPDIQPTSSIISRVSTDGHGKSPHISSGFELIDHPRIVGRDRANLRKALTSETFQWLPDRSHAPSGGIINQLKAVVDKHVKRNHRDCPICHLDYINRPDSVKPHVARKH